MAEYGAAEDRLLLARIEDAARLCAGKSSPRFVGFLDERQGALALRAGRSAGCLCRLYGGYADGERTVFGALPDWCAELGEEEITALFPIVPITITWRSETARRPLTHRDILGTVMGLGIKREAAGDILIEEGRAVLFVMSEVAPYVLSQMDKAGNVGVKAAEGLPETLPGARSFLEITDTVASPRLDAVVAALAGGSRSRAESLIAAGLVSLDGLPCEKGAGTVPEGSIVRIRGVGKFAVDALHERSKKGRVLLRARKYQ